MHDSPIPDPPEAEAEEHDPLAFVPVPLKQVRHDGWTEQRQRDFIAALAAMGSVRHAVRAVGMTKQSAYKLRDRSGAESFAAAWDIALLMRYDAVYDLAMERALKGVTTPLFYRGKQVGTRHHFDHRLAIAALNGTPPMPPALRNKVTR